MPLSLTFPALVKYLKRINFIFEILGQLIIHPLCFLVVTDSICDNCSEIKIDTLLARRLVIVMIILT